MNNLSGSSNALLVGQSTLLSGVQSWGLGLLSLGDLLLLLSDDELDVRWRGLVGVDSTVGSVGSSSLLRSLVHLDVGDLQLGHVQALGLSVRGGVLQQVLDVVDGLSWPSGLLETPLLSLGSSTDRVVESSERNGSLVVQDVREVLLGLLDVPSADGQGSLTGVLERNSQVSTASRRRLGWVDWGSSVTNHCDDVVCIEKISKTRYYEEVGGFFFSLAGPSAVLRWASAGPMLAWGPGVFPGAGLFHPCVGVSALELRT